MSENKIFGRLLILIAALVALFAISVSVNAAVQKSKVTKPAVCKSACQTKDGKCVCPKCECKDCKDCKNCCAKTVKSEKSKCENGVCPMMGAKNEKPCMKSMSTSCMKDGKCVCKNAKCDKDCKNCKDCKCKDCCNKMENCKDKCSEGSCAPKSKTVKAKTKTTTTKK